MPHPAIEKLKQAAAAAGAVTVSVGGQAARAAVPVLRRAAGEVRDRVHRPGAVPDPAPAPATPAPPSPPASPSTATTTPSPASIAKNVPHQRPVVARPPTPRPGPDDVPGGRLPPRR